MPTRHAEAAARTVTITPPTGLVNQVVSVTWSGFDPTSAQGELTDTVLQCKGLVPASLADCYQTARPLGSAVANAKTLANGTGQTFLEVRPAIDLPDLDCSATRPCSVVVYENDNTTLPTNGLPPTAAVAPLVFAPSPSDCPRVGTPDVTTIGEESAASALYAWGGQACTGAKPLSIDYTGEGSFGGRGDFLSGFDDVGITSMPAAAGELTGSKRKFTYAPLDLTSVVIVFNVTDPSTGQAITDMNLTPRLVAELIAGQQLFGPGTTLFQDPEFKALNPGHTWPIGTQPPTVRAGHNADAYVLTSWLEQDAAARAYLQGKDPNAAVDDAWKNVAYPTDQFEALDSGLQGYQPRTGTVINARRLFNFQPPGDTTQINPFQDGLLGVMDQVTAVRFGLPIAKIQPANAAPGTPFVAPTALNVAAGYAAMKTDPDGITKFPDVATRSGYPLVKVDYGMVPTAGVSATKAGKIGAFLDYAAGTGQGLLPPGYLPMPADLKAQTVKARDAVVNRSGTTVTTTSPTTAAPGATDSGSTDQGGAGDAGSGSGSGSGASGGGSSADVAAGTTTASPRAALASAQRPTGGNIIVGAIRDFLSGDNQLIIPVVFVLGVAALLAGPLLASGWPQRLRKRGRARRRGDTASATGS